MRLADLTVGPLSRLPFALGCTSYVIPADIIPNVRALAPVVADVELVLFENPVSSNMLNDKELRVLRELANEHGITYTVHLPTENKAGAADHSERQRYVASANRVIEMCRCLEPHAYIVHLEGGKSAMTRSERDSWASRCSESLQAIAQTTPHRERLVVENLGYPWQWHAEQAAASGAGLCCDVGHLWMYFRDDWRTQMEAMLPRTAVIHLHGVSEGHDHVSLRLTRSKEVLTFLDCLRRFKYTGVVTLEVFTETDFVESAQTVRDLWESLSTQH